MRRLLPPDEVVLNLARSGMHPEDIRRRYGGGGVLAVLRKSPEGRKLIRELDSQRKKIPLRWKGEELSRLLKIYTCCRSVSKTACLLGTNKSAVRRALRYAEVPVLSQSEAQSGKNNPSWRGGMSVDRNGRVRLSRPEHPYANRHGYVLRSRLVMERKLGRFLHPKEVVHHRNDDPSDDRLCNLRLFRSNGEHLRITLAGKCPKWTESGRRRLSESSWKSRKP